MNSIKGTGKILAEGVCGCYCNFKFFNGLNSLLRLLYLLSFLSIVIINEVRVGIFGCLDKMPGFLIRFQSTRKSLECFSSW